MNTHTLNKLGKLLLPLLMLAALVLPANASAVATAAVLQVESKPADSNLYFESNVGQMDTQVKFLGSGEGYRLYLMENELRLAMSSENESSAIGIRFPGSNLNPSILPALPLDGKSHFYRGNDPAFWVEDVAHYGEVTYSELYLGIDLVLHRRNGSPEYDFVVSPGVDPDQIRLAIEGADTMEIDSVGRLTLGFSNGSSIVMQAPVVYQESKEQRVDGRFLILPDNTVAFALGHYDRSKTLVIDPELVFSTYLGGEGDDTYSEGRGADRTGNYTCMHSDANSIPGYGVVRDPSTYEDVDIVCVKHDPSGQIVYATVIGGQADEEGLEDDCPGCDITLDYISDEQGNVHVTGFTTSPDFPTLNAFQTSLLGAEDAFILSLDPTGALAFSSYMGGDDSEGHVNQDHGSAISTASDGSLLIGGMTASPDFLESTGIFVNHLTAPTGSLDNFAMKLNPDRSIAFVSVWGGEEYEQITTIGTDSDGAIFTTGLTESSDYPVSAGAYQDQLKGDSDGFLTKLSPMGAEIVYSSYIGGSADDLPFHGGSVDAKGNYIFTGFTWSADFPVTENAFQGTFGGESDVIIVAFNPGGNGVDDLVYSSFLGGPGYDDAINGVVDRFGNIYIIGEANASGFPLTADAFQSDPGGNADAFLAVLNLSLPSNGQLLYATRIGGANSDASDNDDPDAAGLDFASGLGQDGLGNVYIHGLTVSNDFPVSDGVTIGDFAAIQTEINGPVDAFVAKFHIWDETEIDIRPGDTQNIVYAGKGGVVPMAVLSSLSLDAPAEIDRTSVRLAGAAVMLNGADEPLCRSKDVNRDGLNDLSCHIQANQLSLDTGETIATLIARTHDGGILMGQDVIRLVPESMTVGGLRALLLH